MLRVFLILLVDSLYNKEAVKTDTKGAEPDPIRLLLRVEPYLRTTNTLPVPAGKHGVVSTTGFWFDSAQVGGTGSGPSQVFPIFGAGAFTGCSRSKLCLGPILLQNFVLVLFWYIFGFYDAVRLRGMFSNELWGLVQPAAGVGVGEGGECVWIFMQSHWHFLNKNYFTNFTDFPLPSILRVNIK